MLPNEIANKTIRYAKETVLAFTSNLNRNTSKNTNFINWKFPNASRIKINNDGSSVDLGWVSYGGVARNDQGKWLEGFCGRIGYASPLKVE